MTDLRKAAEMALDALKLHLLHHELNPVWCALEAALAQPEQEPVNTMPTKIFGPSLEQILNAAGFYKREWVGLTDEEIKKIMQRWRNGYIDIKDVEQLLKDKNA